MLTQAVLLEDVDDAVVELHGGITAWNVEVADDNKLGIERQQLVEQIRQLVSERRRDGSRRSDSWSVNVDVTAPGGLTAGQ